MSNVTQIYPMKQGRRPHFIREWAEKRGKEQVDIVRETGADKSQVSRWFSAEKPQTPGKKWIEILAAYFSTEPDALFRHPDEDWFAKFFADRNAAEVAQMKATLEAAFPRKKSG